MLKNYYCTFGSGQPHAGKYILVKAQSMAQARAHMFANYGQKWCACYSQEEWDENQKRAEQRGYYSETLLREEFAKDV